MDQIAAEEYAVLRANQFVLQMLTDVRAPVVSREERKRKRGVCDSYFFLWTAVSAHWTLLVMELSNIPGIYVAHHGHLLTRVLSYSESGPQKFRAAETS